MSVATKRLLVKRNFIGYYLQLQGYGIADPTDAIASCAAYLAARSARAGHRLTDVEFAGEILHISGEIEQDLLRKDAMMRELLKEDPVPARLQECMLVARGRVD